MAKDFFDGLSETLTKTAKELSGRAEILYEVQRVRSKISGEERIVDKILMDIGNIVYKRYAKGEATDGELGVLCEDISQHMQMIASFKEKVADLKGQKICASCQKAVDREAAFCPYCGTACPAPEAEEQAGDVIDAEDCSCGSEGSPEEETETEIVPETAEEGEETVEKDAAE